MLDTLLTALELAIISGKETPEAVAAGVHMRSVIQETQTTLRNPSELLFNAQRSNELFVTLESRAGQVLGGLSNLKGRAETSDAALQEALDLGIEVAALLQSLSTAMAAFTEATDDFLKAGILSEEGAAAMKSSLPRVKTALSDAQLALDQVLARRSGGAETASSSSLTGRFFTSVLLNIEESSLQTTLLPRAAQGVDSLQYLLGLDAPRTYLLIGQNPDEIRPTGGFLGVVVEVHVQDGRLTSLRYFDSDTVDQADFASNPIAPEPIFRYLWITRLLFRDANWNPHFPSSAAQIADLYYKGQGVQADGVIAATEDMVLHLVDALGGVEVPEIVGVLDGATAGKYVDGVFSYPCLPRHTVLRSKRCFDEDLFQAVLGRMMQPLPEERSRAILDVFLQGLAHKDMLVHVFDAKAAEILWEQQWNGALRQVDHDYLMVVDISLPGTPVPSSTGVSSTRSS
ncbi:MAG: DUF4012 domain-containing protein [Chloroflexi bacterium]|nr:DUF4012 domain-containing protein [Chloroflexota bacterium]